MVRYALEQGRWQIDWLLAENEATMLAALLLQPDLVICDHHLPRFSSLHALALLQERSDTTPLIVVTQSIGEQGAVSVLRAGAKDYLTKDRLATLPVVVERVLNAAAIRQREKKLTLDLQAANTRLKSISNKLLAAQEFERQSIARELHDSLGQTLTASLLHLQAAAAATDAQRANTYRDVSMQLLGQAIQQVKTVSFAMCPPQLALLGLEETIEILAQQLLSPSGTVIEQRVFGRQSEDMADRVVVAFRLIQESLTNISRHAAATRVRVRIRFLESKRLIISVADNGCGFDPQQALHRSRNGLHRGLLGMMERCELAGGKWSVRSVKGFGSIVRATL